MDFQHTIERLDQPTQPRATYTPLTAALQRHHAYAMQTVEQWKQWRDRFLAMMVWGMVLALITGVVHLTLSLVFFGVAYAGLMGLLYVVYQHDLHARLSVRSWLKTEPDVELVRQLAHSPEHLVAERQEAMLYLEERHLLNAPSTHDVPLLSLAFPAPKAPRWTLGTAGLLGTTVGMVLSGAVVMQAQPLFSVACWTLAMVCAWQVAKMRQRQWKSWKRAFGLAYTAEQLVLFTKHPQTTDVVQHRLEEVLNTYHPGWSFDSRVL